MRASAPVLAVLNCLSVVCLLALSYVLYTDSMAVIPAPVVQPPEVPQFYNICHCENQDLLSWRMYLHSGNGWLVQEHWVYLFDKPGVENIDTYFLFGANPIYGDIEVPSEMHHGNLYFKQGGQQ